MRLSPGRFGALMGGLTAAFVVGWSLSTATTTRLRRDLADASAQANAIAGLVHERDALQAQQPTTAQLEQVQQDIETLAVEQHALDELRADLQRATLAAMQRPVGPVAVERPPPDGSTPEAMMDTVIRAVRDGEADELADFLDFDEAADRQATEFLSSLPDDVRMEFGDSPHRLIAHVMTAKTKLDSAEVQVDAFTPIGTTDASLRVTLQRANESSRSATFQLHRKADGWRLRVPAKVIEGYRALVTGTPHIATSAAR